jgi:hypothetical protein
MSDHLNPHRSLRILGIAMFLLTVSTLSAQTPSTVPIPTQLTNARTVFISNAFVAAGTDSDADYAQVYNAVQALNRFTIVGTPQEADLVLEFTNDFTTGLGQVLHVLDPKTHTLLWSVVEYAAPAARQSQVVKNRQAAVNRLALDLQRITTPSPTKAN